MTTRPRILILGAAGQVGVELRRRFADDGEIVAADRASIDLSQADRVRDLIRKTQPEIILNAAAYTAVDRAEVERETAMAVNARAPRVLAEEALRLNALLVHYSTDYVFDGEKQQSWVESDIPNPQNFYGTSKLAGEQAIAETGGRYLIFRTSWVYGPHGHNFLLTMLGLAQQRDRISIVDDQHGAPTSSIAIADATQRIVSGILAGQFGAVENWAGLYHMTCSNVTTWCGFAREIFARAGDLLHGRNPEVIPITSAEYPTPAKRPRNSVLSTVLLRARFGVELPAWETALDEVLKVLAKSK